MLLRKLLGVLKMYKNPIGYARSIGVTVGENCFFASPPKWGTEPWLITIGNHVELSGDVRFITHDGATWTFRDEEKYKNVFKYGKIVIHDNCFIGMGSYILPGVEIGENVIIGARSLVTKSVPDNCVYAGSPARFICTFDEYKEKTLASMPTYDVEAYRQNKREVVLGLLKDKMRL